MNCRLWHRIWSIMLLGAGLRLPGVLIKREPIAWADWRYHMNCKRCGGKWSIDI